MQCLHCQRTLQHDAEFCDRCGQRIRLPVGRDAQHRWVTIMFCDLVGSSALSEQLEAEDMRRLLGAYQRACKDEIERHSGSIARYVGDGLLVYFGYPESHEDAAHSAVRGALGVVSAVAALDFKAGGRSLPLQVRIGIETGSVLIGHTDPAASLERDALVGSVPNVAARLQALARPNGILVGEVTHRRLCEDFECRAAGEVSLKGIARPLRVHEVIGEIGGDEVPLWRTVRRLSPMVGRDTQLQQLRDAWHQAKRSQPAVVCVSGEAGVGKSRLVRALLEDVEGDNIQQIVYRCAPQHRDTPLHPAATQLQQAFGLGAGASAEDRRFALAERTQRLGLAPPVIAALASLAGVPPDPARLAVVRPPADVRRGILDALSAMVVASTHLAPTVMVVEDLHWCDPSTEEFLATLCASALPSRLLLLLTHRPQVEPAWARSAASLSIRLDRLSRPTSREVVQTRLAGHAVSDSVIDRVLDRAEGIPLFLEEFASSLAEAGGPEDSPSGDGALSIAIPDSLQASLTARLDRIGAARRVAQVAAIFGRSFSLAQLKAMPEFQGADLDPALRELARKGLLGAAPGSLGAFGDEYEFSHALIRDAAYQSMLREDRQALHQRVAECLLSDFSNVAAAQPELVAHHFTEAKVLDRAVEYCFLAGQKAMERLANVETIEHLRRGLAMLEALDSVDRPMRELGFHTALMPALCATRGYANLEVEQTFSRAHELCKQLGSIPALSAVLYGLWSYYLVRADLVRSRQLAQEMKQIADQTGDALQHMESELSAGLTSMYEGNLRAAADNFHRILQIWEPGGPQFFTAGEDIRASTKAWLSIVYWHQGDIDRAKAVAQESLYRARHIGQPISLAFSLYFNVFLAHFCRDVQTVNALAQEGLQLCNDKKLFWGTLCVLQLGWAMTEMAPHGDVAAGTTEMLKGLTGFRLAGARLTQTYYLAMIAQARLLAGESDECERLLTEALAAAEETGERLWRSELLRLRGEVAARSGSIGSADGGAGLDGAEGLFRAALAHAQAIDASSLALRAAVALARCLGLRQRHVEAATLLAAALATIHCTGTTPDIDEARGLLAALRQSGRRVSA